MKPFYGVKRGSDWLKGSEQTVLPLPTSPKPKFNTNFTLRGKQQQTRVDWKEEQKIKKLQKQKLDTVFFPDQILDWKGIVGNDPKLEGALPYQHTAQVRGNHYPSSSSRHHRSLFSFSVSLELQMEVKQCSTWDNHENPWDCGEREWPRRWSDQSWERKRNSLKTFQTAHGALLVSTVLQMSGLTYHLSYAVQ